MVVATAVAWVITNTVITAVWDTLTIMAVATDTICITIQAIIGVRMDMAADMGSRSKAGMGSNGARDGFLDNLVTEVDIHPKTVIHITMKNLKQNRVPIININHPKHTEESFSVCFLNVKFPSLLLTLKGKKL